MNVSRRWLEELLRRPLELPELMERLAMLGAPVEAVEALHAGLCDIVVAEVEEVRPHPNADRLRVCTVNAGGSERRNVVCGAPNVAAGQKYPFAPLGATLPGGLKIEKRKIRGETSEGMLCSARELGLGQDHDGIMQLDTAAAPGTPFLQVLPVDDDRLVIDVTPNRPDLLGHRGVARDLAAVLGVQVRLPVLPGAEQLDLPSSRRESTEATVGGVTVRIEDLEGCGRFHAAVIRGVRVGPSPEWLRRRLEAVGVRSINNVVDATNYVMMELNQPMHAYDLRRLAGPALVVRRARAGERIVTLDGVERTLDGDAIAIADENGVVGIAGIMGGASTEVSDETRDVVLEAAYWDPARVRQTRRALDLSSEASYRFERGVDRWSGAQAMRRCIEVVLATAGGELVEPPVDLWPQPSNPSRIFLRPSRVAQVLGVDLPWHAIEKYLVALGATVLAKPEDDRLAVDVPGWRPDLQREIDLVEEIARIHGYDEIPTELRRYRVGSLPDAAIERVASTVRDGLVAQGLFEVATLPMDPGGPDAVRLANPLSAESAYLRTRLLPGLVREVEANWANRVRDVRLFEIGTVFTTVPGAAPNEARHVAGVVTGAREPAHWTAPRTPDVDHWDLKGIFEAAVALAQPGATVQVEAAALVARAADGAEVGRAATLDADAPPWAAPVYGFEVMVDPTPRRPIRFRALPSTPASERVLALLLPAGLGAARVEAVIRAAAGPLLETVDVLSDYRGAELPAGSRSVAFRLVVRAADRTLRDAEVDELEQRVLAALDRELEVRRREATPSRGGA